MSLLSYRQIFLNSTNICFLFSLTRIFYIYYNALKADGRNSVRLHRMPVSVQETRNLMSVPIALCSLRLFGYMALTDRLAGDYRSQRRYSADKKRYPSGLVSDKTPTPFLWFWRQAVFALPRLATMGSKE